MFKSLFVVMLVVFAQAGFAQQWSSPPTILCGSFRAAQNEGGCDNPSARAYDAAGRLTPYLIGEVRQITNTGQYAGYVNQWGQVSGYIPNQQIVGYPAQQVVQPLWGQQWGGGQIARYPQLPPNCQMVEKATWQRVSDGAGSALVGAIVGALGGHAIDRWRGTGGRWTEIGAASMGAMGFAQGSQPGMTVVCQAAVQQALPANQVVQQSEQPIQVRNPCEHDPGTKRGVLNLPGHPKNGQTVCAKPGDLNISSWLD